MASKGISLLLSQETSVACIHAPWSLLRSSLGINPDSLLPLRDPTEPIYSPVRRYAPIGSQNFPRHARFLCYRRVAARPILSRLTQQTEGAMIRASTRVKSTDVMSLFYSLTFGFFSFRIGRYMGSGLSSVPD